MSDDVVIVSAVRTPVGSFNGAFATTPAHDLGAIAIKAALERAGVEGGRVSEVIMGQILTAEQRQHVGALTCIEATLCSRFGGATGAKYAESNGLKLVFSRRSGE